LIDHHHTIRLTWCKHNSASGSRWRQCNAESPGKHIHFHRRMRSYRRRRNTVRQGVPSWERAVSGHPALQDVRCHRNDQRWRRRWPQASTWLDVRHKLNTADTDATQLDSWVASSAVCIGFHALSRTAVWFRRPVSGAIGWRRNKKSNA